MSFAPEPWLAFKDWEANPQLGFAELGTDASAIHGHRDARVALPQSPILPGAPKFCSTNT